MNRKINAQKRVRKQYNPGKFVCKIIKNKEKLKLLLSSYFNA